MSPWAALLMAWIRPAATARRTDHVSLPRAFGVHAAMLFLLVLFVVVVDASGGSASPPWQVGALTVALESYVGYQAAECMERPTEFVLTQVGIAALVAGAGVALAFLAMPWAAGDEPMGSSYRAALRRTWLGTSALLPAVLFFCFVLVILVTLRKQWQATDNTQWPVPLEVPGKLQPNTPEFGAYMHEVEVYREELNRVLAEYRRRQPWYVRYDELLLMLTFLAAGPWVLWVWLRFVSAERGLPPRDHEPLCEACGYNLTRAELDRNCPECGVPVRESLGPEARPGPPWERRADIGAWAGWWQSARGAILTPKHFGRQVRLRSCTLGFASFLASNLGLLLVYAWGGWLACFVAITRHQWPQIDLLDMVTSTGFLATCTMGIALGLVCLIAVMVGLGYRLRDRRNLLPVTIQAAAYVAPLLALWMLSSAASAVAIILAGSAFEDLAGVLGLTQFGLFATELLQFVAWILVNLVFLTAYIHRVARVTAGARWANR